MERDSLGRFLPGNQVAKGNRGNRQPKTGNKNAFKQVYLGSLGKKYFHTTEKGEIMIDVQAVQDLIDVYGLPESIFGEPEYVEYYE